MARMEQAPIWTAPQASLAPQFQGLSYSVFIFKKVRLKMFLFMVRQTHYERKHLIYITVRVELVEAQNFLHKI